MQGKLNPIVPNTIDSYTKLLLHGDGPDASTNIIDVTGKVVTPSGNARLGYSPKMGEGCVSFDGSGDYLEIPDSDDFYFGSESFTIDWQIKFNALQNGGIFNHYQSPGDRFTCYYNYNDGGGPNNLITVSINSGGGWVLLFHVNFEPIIGKWYHMALIRDGNVWNFYVDGVALTKDYANGNYTNSIPNYSGNFKIGWWDNVYYLNGEIDEFRISKGIARWTENFLVDSATSKTVTNNNVSISTSEKKFGNNSAEFNGANAYLSILNSNDFNFENSDFTVDCWIKPASISATYYILGTGNQQLGGNGWSLGLHAAGLLWWNSENISISASHNWNINTWHHIAIVRNNLIVKMYIDGIEVASDIVSANISSTNSLNIGQAPAGTPYDFWGYIDEIRISKGIARWTSNFSVPSSPYTSDTYDKLLLHLDNSFTVPTLTYTPDSYTKLLCHFEDYSDSGATGHTITPNGNTHIETKKLGNNAIRLDGNSSGLTILDNDDFYYASGNFTIDFWINITSFNGHAYVYRQWQDSEHEFVIYIADNGSIRFHSYAGAGFEFIKETQAGVIVLGQWYHIACTREGNTADIFINGIKQSYPTYNTNPSGSLTNFSAPITISGPWPTSSFFIDEFRVSKGIARLGETFLTDFATAKIVANTDVIPSTITKKFGNSSAYFNDTTSTLIIPDSDDLDFGDGDFTIDCWVNLNSLTSGYGQTIYHHAQTGQSYSILAWQGGSWWVGIYINNFYIKEAYAADPTMTAGQWHHIAIVRHGQTINIYRDGILKLSEPLIYTYPNYTGDFAIGNAFGATSSWALNGYLDEFRVSKGIARWTSNFTPASDYYVIDAYDKLLLHFDIALFTPPTVPYSKEEATKINFPGFQKIYDHVCNGSESKLSVLVDGDTDLEYITYIRNPSTTRYIQMYLNNDKSASYGEQWIQNSNGGLAAGRSASQVNIGFCYYNELWIHNLYTPKGFVKTATQSQPRYASGTNLSALTMYGYVYNSTVNITSLDFQVDSDTFDVGTHIIVFARRST